MTDYMFRALPGFIVSAYKEPPADGSILDIWCAGSPPGPTDKDYIKIDFGQTYSAVIASTADPQIDDPYSAGGYGTIHPNMMNRTDKSLRRGSFYVNEAHMPPTPHWKLADTKIPMYQCLIRYQGGVTTRFHGFLATINSENIGGAPDFLVDFYWANDFAPDEEIPSPLPSGIFPIAKKVPVNLADKTLYEYSKSTLNDSSNVGDVGILFLSAAKFKAANLLLPKLPPSLGGGLPWP